MSRRADGSGRAEGLPDLSGFTEDERQRAEAVLAGRTTVVNVRRSGPHKRLVPWLVERGLVRYVGHAGNRHAWPRSDFANPFVKEAKSDREAMVRHYEQWLDQQPDLLHRIAEGELTGWALGCWCAPQRCHADVLAERS